MRSLASARKSQVPPSGGSGDSPSLLDDGGPRRETPARTLRRRGARGRATGAGLSGAAAGGVSWRGNVAKRARRSRSSCAMRRSRSGDPYAGDPYHSRGPTNRPGGIGSSRTTRLLVCRGPTARLASTAHRSRISFRISPPSSQGVCSRAFRTARSALEPPNPPGGRAQRATYDETAGGTGRALLDARQPIYQLGYTLGHQAAGVSRSSACSRRLAASCRCHRPALSGSPLVMTRPSSTYAACRSRRSASMRSSDALAARRCISGSGEVSRQCRALADGVRWVAQKRAGLPGPCLCSTCRPHTGHSIAFAPFGHLIFVRCLSPRSLERGCPGCF